MCLFVWRWGGESCTLTVGGEEKVGSVLLRQPSNLIDLLLNLQTLKVVKFRLMALKGAVHVVLSLGKWLILALWTKKKHLSEKKHAFVLLCSAVQCMSGPDSILYKETAWIQMVFLKHWLHQLFIKQSTAICGWREPECIHHCTHRCNKNWNIWVDRQRVRVPTSGSLWKMTTRPPLSPVASSSPVWLNSTVEIISAGDSRNQRWGTGNKWGMKGRETNNVAVRYNSMSVFSGTLSESKLLKLPAKH